MGDAPDRFKSKAATELSTPPLRATTIGVSWTSMSSLLAGDDEHQHVLADAKLAVILELSLIDALAP